MDLATLIAQLKAAAASPPEAPVIRALNPGAQRTRQTAVSQARALQQARRQIADEARKKITG